ncbi:calpain family cysteine protease containing protein [Stylonychia lemnae]|uniref:Calpain family cysteine protease containing protein n=1 Tax=Stylonychia lemnae TaxID=5949 RepID=A0A077ZNK0_STYLE|nr:calpain family cysteine protease containing protein [Stylonychia lemnae]|eukprot:CDW71552.1 calpain family cysteine protease containing protein [Stylonychia lemnae]
MRQIVTFLTLLAGCSQAGFLQDYSLKQLLEIINRQGQPPTPQSRYKVPQECYSAIFRWKKGPPNYKDILNKGEEWTDASFPPESSSIRWPDKSDNDMLSAASVATWKRLQKLYPFGTMFGTEGCDHDIAQGSVGDCYYLAGVGSISQNSTNIEKIFINPERNNAGLFAVNVWVRGIPSVIVVDDWFPYMTSYRGLFGAKAGLDESLWGPILEKVWAKLNGNYENINGGMMNEPYKLLSNVKTKSYKMVNVNTTVLWQLISDARSKNFLISTWTEGGNDQQKCNYSIPCGHAFTLYQAKELTNTVTNVKYHIYQVKNPWRSDADYSGSWRDNSTMWSIDGNTFAQQVNLTQSNDGYYWLNETEMLDGFAGFQISPYFSSWTHSWFNKEDDDGLKSTYLISLNQTTPMTITIDLYDRRMFAYGCKTLNTVAKIKIKQGTVTIAQSTFWDYWEGGWIDYTTTPLAAGNYSIEVTIEWQFKDLRDYTLTIYAPYQIAIIDNSTKLQSQREKHDLKFTPTSQKWNNKVMNQRVQAPTQEYTFTGNLTADLIGARNSTGLGYKGADWYYSFNKTVAYNSTRDELVYYIGTNNTFIEINITISVWTLNTQFEFTGNKASQCKLSKPGYWEFLECNCILNAYKGNNECGISMIGVKGGLVPYFALNKYGSI